MNRIEKILFSRVELWVVLLFLILSFVFLIIFGAMVRNVATGGDTFGLPGRLAYRLASMPSDMKDMLTYEDPHSISAAMSLMRDQDDAARGHGRFEGRSGFTFSYEPGSGIVDDFLLLSRYDRDKGMSVVEFFDLDAQTLVHAWPIVESAFRTQRFDNPFIRFPNQSNAKMTIRHPFVDENGSLVFHSEMSPLYSVDSCGNVEWTNAEYAFHHSVERGPDGSYWVPGARRTSIDTFDHEFVDDHIVRLSADGRVLYSKSVTGMLIEADLINRMYVYDRYIRDPIHLNDIEPVREDSAFWKKGDVFLSLGHLNMVVLFRPATETIVWWTQELMMHQHDVDIVAPGKISVYNNNRTTRAGGDTVIGRNELILFDLEDSTYGTHYDDPFREQEIVTINQGLHDFSTAGRVMVEETNFGRVLLFDEAGDVYWEYVNRASDDKIYTTNWSRLVPGRHGETVAAALGAPGC